MILQTLGCAAARVFAIPTLALLPLLALTAQAADESLTVLTYNVAALPPVVQLFKNEPELDPLVHVPLIAPRLDANAYDVVAMQECFVHGTNDGPPYDDFSLGVGTLFWDTLTANGGAPPFEQVAPADIPIDPQGVASGLGRLSTSTFTGYFRNKWDRLELSDAASDKGYSFARHEVDEGVFVDVYNWHGNAGSSEANELGRAARRENIEELIKAINANSSGKAVVVMGDTNTLYPRSFDTIRRLLGLEEAPAEIPDTEDLDVPLKDVWVEVARAGSVPPQNGVALNQCFGEEMQAGPNCEHKDKILYRSGDDVRIEPTEYFVEMDFLNEDMPPVQLSDHWPVGAEFTVPEPRAASVVALFALAGLARLRDRRASRG